MSRELPVMVIVILGVAGCQSAVPAPPSDAAVPVLTPTHSQSSSPLATLSATELERQLTECVNRIQVGMRRQQVEQILPRDGTSGYASTASISGGAQGVTYLVAAGYTVTVFYDYTGVPRDASGRALTTSSPDNRVLDKPKLRREP